MGLSCSSRGARYVRDARWKLTGTGELFDLKEAPFKETVVTKEMEDAAAKASRAKLQTVLDGYKAEQAAAAIPVKKKKKDSK